MLLLDPETIQTLVSPSLVDESHSLYSISLTLLQIKYLAY